MNAGELLVAQDLVLDRGSRRVLDGVSMKVRRADTYAIVGPSGSGKTSLLRCLNRLEEPGGGRVMLEGVDIREIPPVELRCRVGLVGQVPSIFAGGVRANLAYGLKEVDEAAMATALERAGLQRSFLDRGSDELSVGEAQRVCIARALMRDPQVLLLDEPTASLDRDSQRAIEHLIETLGDGGVSVVMVSHDLSQTARLADRAILLSEGRVFAEGSMEEVEKAWPEVSG